MIQSSDTGDIMGPDGCQWELRLAAAIWSRSGAQSHDVQGDEKVERFVDS
jgi:hypothetical protein